MTDAARRAAERSEGLSIRRRLRDGEKLDRVIRLLAACGHEEAKTLCPRRGQFMSHEAQGRVSELILMVGEVDGELDRIKCGELDTLASWWLLVKAVVVSVEPFLHIWSAVSPAIARSASVMQALECIDLAKEWVTQPDHVRLSAWVRAYDKYPHRLQTTPNPRSDSGLPRGYEILTALEVVSARTALRACQRAVKDGVLALLAR